MMYDEVCWRCTTLFGKSPPTVVGFDSPRNTKQTTMTQWHYYWRRPFPNKMENHISHTTTCSNAKSFLSFEILAAFGNSGWPFWYVSRDRSKVVGDLQWSGIDVGHGLNHLVCTKQNVFHHRRGCFLLRQILKMRNGLLVDFGFNKKTCVFLVRKP